MDFFFDLLDQLPLLCGGMFLLVLILLATAKQWVRVRRFTLQIVGVWITLWAYFFAAWIKFEPWSFLGNDAVNIAGELLPGLFSLLENIKFHEKVFGILRQLTGLNGFWATLIQLNFNPFLRLAIAGPALVGLLAFGLACFSPFVSNPVKRFLGWAQAAVAGGAILLLMGYLNYLDSWGSYKVFATGTLTLLTGAHLGAGPYWALVGLLVLVATGLWQTTWTERATSDLEDNG